ncbi:hypothetical protein AGDE_07200 [Angomonas deanei]|nr:hypothetical protein AGDE_07200 [Angomonas deanei]|eukprot:EPY35865.1 hypothetical protein AGDE_07200 [Angomonas deanei]
MFRLNIVFVLLLLLSTVRSPILSLLFSYFLSTHSALSLSLIKETTLMSEVNTTSSPNVLYSTLAEAKSGGDASLKPIPAYDLYKTAREEELTVYRGVCRVMAMRRRDAPTKAVKRLLEDLQEELCIPAERAELEWETAMNDEVIEGIHKSGVLARRENFYDGVEDVPIEKVVAHAKDDGRTMFTTKAFKTEDATNAAAAAAGRALNKKKKNTAALASINTIEEEVKKAARELLFSKDVDVAQKKSLLEQKKQELLQLKDELLLNE